MAHLEIKKFPDKLHEEMKQQAQSEDRTLKAWVTRALKEALRRSDKSRRWQET
jgi:predicted HicB family RNase H-like nuclease